MSYCDGGASVMACAFSVKGSDDTWIREDSGACLDIGERGLCTITRTVSVGDVYSHREVGSRFCSRRAWQRADVRKELLSIDTSMLELG